MSQTQGQVKNIQNITVLGATGSIGASTLDVIARHPDKYRAFALTGNRQVEKMAELCRQFQPDFAVMAEEDSAEQLLQLLKQAGIHTIVLSGVSGLEQVAATPAVDQVMAAIVGAAGLRPTLAAVRAGKRVLLANKESLVMAGALMLREVREHNAQLLPIDSEHNAIFQAMPGNVQIGQFPVGVEKIVLTGSGGPFRTRPLDQFAEITPEEAVAHPNWSMGKKISIDSATMMNKGLEFIEACWLFGAHPDQIDVVIHPQSVIHSMVQYVDGSVLAQMGNPDMRTPIAYALAWPERVESGVGHLNLFDVARLDFEQPDFARYPGLRLTIEAMRQGGSATTILNAANEIAVVAFLAQKIKFTEIVAVIEKTLEALSIQSVDTLEMILAADAQARDFATQTVQQLEKN